MKSKVFFSDARTKYGNNLTHKLIELFKAADLKEIIDPAGDTAIKMHWGEKGNLAFVPPPLVRTLVDCIKNAGGRPFITDTNTLYRGSRSNALDNYVTAIENGFSYAVVGAPIIVADGLRGDDFVRVDAGGKHFKKVKIASGLYYAKSMIALSHFKGHEATGFGGALKNIGMGSACPSGKQNMHSDIKPKVKLKRCISCGSCAEKCPSDAISLTADGGKAAINYEKCIGCAECTVVCPAEAIGVNWESDLNVLMEKMAEYAAGCVKNKPGKTAFINVILDVSPDCDCCNWSDVSIVPDIGIVVSTDPVAADQASLDLVNEAPVIPTSRLAKKNPDIKDKFAALSGVDGTHQLAYAEKLGLGSRKYELIRVG